MSKSKASRRARDAKHVRLYLYILKTPAWLSLSCQAKCLLIELQALYNGTNNGELFLSIREAAKRLNTGTKQASAAFVELQDRGFVVTTRKGSRTRRGEQRLATCWRLTEYDDDLTGRQPTKEFIAWRPGQKNSTVVPETTHRSPRDHATALDEPKNALDRGPRDYAQPDFEASTVVPETTQLVNHIDHPKIGGPIPQTAPPTAAPDTPKTGFSKPSGSQTSKAKWLRDHLDSGAVSASDVAAILGVSAEDVPGLASGRTSIGAKLWNRLAELVVSRMN